MAGKYLTRIERMILSLRLWEDSHPDGMTKEEVAKYLCLSKEFVDRTEREALTKLREGKWRSRDS